MSDQDLFSSENITPTPEPSSSDGDVTTSSGNALADLLSSIRNEDGKPKYDSVEKAIEALMHSQDHIRRLEDERKLEREELERMREMDANRENVEQIVERLLAARNPEPQPQVTPQGGGVDPSAVEQMIQRTLEANRARELAEQNAKVVKDTLTAKFGDKTKEVVSSKAAELGFTVEELGALAAKSPKAVLAYFNVAAVNRAAPATTSVNMPLNAERANEMPVLEKSIMAGATMREQKDAFARSREYTNKRLGITE